MSINLFIEKLREVFGKVFSYLSGYFGGLEINPVSGVTYKKPFTKKC